MAATVIYSRPKVAALFIHEGQNGIFVDAFDAKSLDPAVAKFVEGWRGDGAPSVVDAIGYDSLLLAAGALAKGGDPAEASSAEWVEYCEKCGAENPGSYVEPCDPEIHEAK